MHNQNGHDGLLRAMARTHPWSARISCDFFKVSFDAAFRRMVQLYLKQERISPRELGLAVDDELLVKRVDEGRPVLLATADTVFEVMGQPPLGTLFLKEVEAYLEITETKADTLGLEAVRDRLFVTKLREGHSPYLGRRGQGPRMDGRAFPPEGTPRHRRGNAAQELVPPFRGRAVRHGGGVSDHGAGGAVPGPDPRMARSDAGPRRGTALLQGPQGRTLPAPGPRRVGALKAAPAHVRRRHGKREAGEPMNGRRTLLNTEQAARRVALSPRTLERFRVTGGGPEFVKMGHTVRYAVSKLDEWIQKCNRKSTSDDGRVSEKKPDR